MTAATTYPATSLCKIHLTTGVCDLRTAPADVASLLISSSLFTSLDQQAKTTRDLALGEGRCRGYSVQRPPSCGTRLSTDSPAPVLTRVPLTGCLAERCTLPAGRQLLIHESSDSGSSTTAGGPPPPAAGHLRQPTKAQQRIKAGGNSGLTRSCGLRAHCPQCALKRLRNSHSGLSAAGVRAYRGLSERPDTGRAARLHPSTTQRAHPETR